MKYFIANWKMYVGLEKSRALAMQYAGLVLPQDVTGVICPTTLSFTEVSRAVAGTNWQLGAQNVSWTPEGAYTGAVSAEFFREAGARYTLVGHSERRYIFGETDHDVRKKIMAALSVGLTPILCVGETADDLASGKRQYRLKKQLMLALEDLPNADRVFIAYEPVWAIHGIGSGIACLPADVADIHNLIKEEVKQYGISEPTIFYGGSVNAGNCAAYLTLPNVHGVVTGTASLHPAEVKSILSFLATC